MLRCQNDIQNSRMLHDFCNFFMLILSKQCNGFFNRNDKLFSSAYCVVLNYLSFRICLKRALASLKKPEAYSVLLYISLLIFPLDSLIFFNVTLSHVDLAHGSGSSKMLLVLCVCVVFAVYVNQNISKINKE